jgi:hypothetical protein
VTKIEILNRADCCGGRINNAKVYVGKTLCGTIKNARQGTWLTLNCRARGNTIKIVGAPKQYLHFCGIRVWATDCLSRAPKVIKRGKKVIRIIRKPGRKIRIIRTGKKIIRIIRRPGKKPVKIIGRPGGR